MEDWSGTSGGRNTCIGALSGGGALTVLGGASLDHGYDPLFGYEKPKSNTSTGED